MDDLDTTHECLASHIKRWSDRYAEIGETKGGAVGLRHKWFIITSQYMAD